MQKGCRARLAIADKVEEVFFRLGLLLCDADSPERHLLLRMKRVTHTTLMPCHVCPIGQEDLADGDYDIARNRRTDDQTEYALKKRLTIAPFRNDIWAELGATPDTVVTDTKMMENTGDALVALELLQRRDRGIHR
ncbi:unnamed protein product [Ectocarpus sp. 4 AP-2014]